MGHSKARAIVCGVLAPLLKEQFLAEIKGKKFAISLDASNHSEIKVFPILLRFSTNGVIKNRLLKLASLKG